VPRRSSSQQDRHLAGEALSMDLRDRELQVVVSNSDGCHKASSL